MLRAIQYCHEVIRVVHRDIKPDNVMIAADHQAVLIDFGVSVLCGDNDSENAALRQKSGTYMFFAPELFTGETKTFGHATDLWALGITFYYLLTG